MARELFENDCYVALTHEHLDAKVMIDKVRSPKAGAIVLFAGNKCYTALGSLYTEFCQVLQETTLLESQ